MKRYIKSGSELRGKSFADVLNIAKTNPICCISAITDVNRNDPEKRSYDTKRLESDIAADYDYIPVLGGWVDPKYGESTEESFIVIGYDYDKQNPDIFKDWMIHLCGKYDQWAVLIIDKVYDDDISDDMKSRRMDQYRLFSDPKYSDRDLNKSEYKSQRDMHERLMVTNDLDLYQIHGVYYDRNGNITDEFYNVSPRQIGDYFTQLAPGARFTLMASQIVRPKFFSNPSTIRAYHRIMSSDQRISSLDRYKRSNDFLERASAFEKIYFG